MDNKTAQTLEQLFQIVQKFAEDNGLFCDTKVQSAINQNEFMIYASKDGNPIDSSVAYWSVDVVEGLTFSGIKPKAKLWQACMFDHWDSGTYNLNSERGVAKLNAFLQKSLDGYNNRRNLIAKTRQSSEPAGQNPNGHGKFSL